MAPKAAPPGKLIERDLTPTFKRFRNNRRAKQGGLFGIGAEQTGHRLLDREVDTRRGIGGGAGLGGDDLELAAGSLPPSWTDSAAEAREELKNIRDKIVQLTKAQNKRLLQVFVDDASPDKEVENISNQLSALVRRCEQHIHKVKGRADAGCTQKESQCRENVQRNLAVQLQQLSQQFRQAQKDYMSEIRKRQKGALWDDGPGDAAGAAGDGGVDIGFTDSQAQELDTMEVNAVQRSTEISQIATSINELHTIFKELAVLVIDQGSILDRIDYNIEQVVHQSVQANKQLKKAEDSQKSNRAMKCIIALVVIDMILILILVMKARS